MNKFARKITTSAVAFATVVSMSGAAALVPSVASAATVAELEAQIQALLAQLATLTGGSTTTGGACYTFTRDLTVGSQGEDVMNLQKAMNAMGFTVSTSGAGSAGAESTYFGAKTQAAVAAWQASKGVAPAAGYFGPKSRTAYAASCSTTGTGTGTGTGSTGSTTLKGGAGSLADADFISSLNNEEVGEDEEDVEVAGLEIEAEGSDIEITAVTLDFDYADTGADEDLDDYADEVSIWLDGEEIARLDADEFDDDNNYSKTVALDSGAIIEEDEVGELVVAVSGVSNLDSTNAGEKWNVAFEGIRFRDAQNAVVTDTSTGDIVVGNDDTTTAAGEREFSFESFATAADLEVKFDEDDDSINDAHVIDIDATNDTDNVAILSFEIEIEGDSDVTMDDLPVDFYSVGVNLDDAISAVSLWYDGDEVGSENMTITTTNGTTTFDDLDLELAGGETHAFEVRADFKSIADGIVPGNTVQALISTTNADNADIEDENGDNVADTDVTGSATGEAHALYDNGIMVDFVSKDDWKSFTADEAGERDEVTFEFVFDVTAFGADMYIDKEVLADSAPTASVDGNTYSSTSQSTAAGTTSSVSSVIASSENNTNDTATQFIVEENDTREFTITIVQNAAIDGVIQVELEGINWGTSGAADSSPDQLYNFNLVDFVSRIVTVTVQ